MQVKSALLIVDVQVDFCPGGALPVSNGDQVVPVLNEYIEKFVSQQYPIFASRDWHPLESNHFLEHGGKWPPHCIQNTDGAKFHPALRLPESTILLSKGMDPEQDGYTAFQGIAQNGSSFSELLELEGILDLYVGGLATDYCVKWSVLNALEHGMRGHLLIDAVRGVNLVKSDSSVAIELMKARGAQVVTIDQLSFY